MIDKRKQEAGNADKPKIARIWHGRTAAARADEYKQYLFDLGVKKIASPHVTMSKVPFSNSRCCASIRRNSTFLTLWARAFLRENSSIPSARGYVTWAMWTARTS